MNIKKIMMGITLVCASFGTVFSIDGVGGGAVTVTNTGTLTETTSESATAVGGNVTQVNVQTNISTIKWQGFYGNIGGNISLGIGTDNFYSFGAALFQTIYVTQGTNTDWVNLVAGNAADVDTTWNFGVADDVDQAVDVFTGSSTFAGVAIVPSTNIGSFNMGILNNGTNSKSTTVFVADIENPGIVGFDSNSFNYQIMVPVETTVAETYNFYVSLK
ncbi:MAG: hypothetical protein HRU03_02490 [Nanoarchaeales archaeon]|nr:hypothetical protein [Nanoarchaeales archaeon]